MKKLVAITLAFVGAIGGCAITSPTSNVGASMQEYRIGGGLKITLPVSWAFSSHPIPIPGTTNFMAAAGGVKMAITGLPTNKPMLSESELVSKASDLKKHYLGSNFKDAPPTQSFSNAKTTGVYTPLCSKSGEKEFKVFPGSAYECVTQVILSTQGMVFSISIASDSNQTAEYTAALTALKGVN